MATPDVMLPQIAIIGAGIFVRTQYIPRLREIADHVIIKAIWSRSEESAKAAVELARDFAPKVECKWGDSGLEDIIQDSSIKGVAVVLAGQVQVDISLKMLRMGKHVIQGILENSEDNLGNKPAAESTNEADTALSCYKSLCDHFPSQPIWAVAENYRFEPAFVEARKLVNEIGDMINIQVIVEGSMNSSNPYFSSSWRRKIAGGFILDMGVHFIAGLRMSEIGEDQFVGFLCENAANRIVGCEITTVSAIARHVDMALPPPDNICALFQVENGCAGVFVMVVSSASPKIYWRVDGSNGTLQIERGSDNGQHGYMVLLYKADGHCQRTFHPFSGVNEELKAFVQDITQATSKEGVAGQKAEPRSSYVEGARDVAVLEAMLESSRKQGAQVHVKKF